MNTWYFKDWARRALKGNWQTALVVTFFAGALGTLLSVLQSLWLPDPTYVAYGMYGPFLTKLAAVSDVQWFVMCACALLTLLLTPALDLGANHYFVRRLNGEDPSVAEGLLGRVRCWWRALCLYLLMGVKVALWSALFVVPGVLAALRYSLAPWILAENPDMKPREAIEESKRLMDGRKMEYFMLIISFVGWSLLANAAQLLLMDINMVLALVAAQFMQLAIAVYMNGACAAFYLVYGKPDGAQGLKRQMGKRLREMGVDETRIRQMGYGEEEQSDVLEPDENDEDE